MSEIAQAPLNQPATDGWAFEPDVTKNRIIRRYTAAFADYWPGDVHKVKVRGSAGGATGGQTASPTRGAGGGGGGQWCAGEIDVTPYEPYSGTPGAGGPANLYPTNGGNNVNGNPGSNSTFINGTRTPVTLAGGNPGLANGTGGAVAGPATYVSLLGLTMVQGAAGGNAQNSDVGLPGGRSDVSDGGLGGNTSGGGGGGAGIGSRGGNAGNYETAATDIPIANSGAGTGGGGADSTTVGRFGSPKAADGFWEFEYWTAEEEQ